MRRRPHARRGGRCRGCADQYVWGVRYIDDLVRHDGKYVLSDIMFSVVAALDSSDAVAERYRYTAYGQRDVLDPDFTNDADGLSDVGLAFGHQGMHHDGAMGGGLVYNRMRYRESGLGRWMSRDPLGYVDGSSMYLAHGASPLVASDPTGLRQLYVLRGRARNWSKSRCAIVWSDFDGDWKGHNILRPGDDTGGWLMEDQNDFIYVDGKWYKNRSRDIVLEDQGPPWTGGTLELRPGRGGKRGGIWWRRDPVRPVAPNDNAPAPGKGNWPAPSEDICREYCKCDFEHRHGRQPEADDCDEVDECVKSCRKPF
jgi:RHS repeat-associated protein